MDKEKDIKIRYIEIIDPPRSGHSFHVIDGYSFKTVQKNGEMALINWIEVWKDGQCVAEFRESNCNIFLERHE